IGLDNDKCAEEIQKLAEGKQINVSMAAKVAHDKCTWCGHAAKTDNDRCSHIPKYLGELNKRGEMCSMDNIDPKWFEISIVGRPADRIGMSLKLASASRYIKTAADYRELYPGFVAPQDDDHYIRISKYASEKRQLVKKLAEIEKQIADYGNKAREGKLSIEELTGGTFSISNGGVFGSMLSTPIINPPQSAILGIHATKERAVVEDGQIVIRPINYLALSYDHRIIDGREAVLGLVAMKELLEDPARLLLDL
ncbi:MAG: hypothetical protein RLZZ539_874, partial [Pseudomonadota bacterium]